MTSFTCVFTWLLPGSPEENRRSMRIGALSVWLMAACLVPRAVRPGTQWVLINVC